MALDPIQQSFVLLALAVREARSVLAEPGLSSQSRLAKLQRLLGNDVIEVIVQGAEIAMTTPAECEADVPSDRCPVCKGAKTIAGATCFRCKGSGEAQQMNAG